MKGKNSKLYEWCKQKGIFSSADIHKWGGDNFYICAKRRVLEFTEDPKMKIRRLFDDEVTRKGLIKEGCQKIAWYIYNEGKKQEELFDAIHTC